MFDPGLEPGRETLENPAAGDFTPTCHDSAHRPEIADAPRPDGCQGGELALKAEDVWNRDRLSGSTRQLGIEDRRRTCRAIRQQSLALGDLESHPVAESLVIPLFEVGV